MATNAKASGVLTPEEIKKIAHLAKLNLTPEEVEQYSAQLTQVLEYFKQISAIDTNGIEPLVTPTEIEMEWRADKVETNFTAKDMVANAPQKTGNLFTVPPVV